MDLALVEQLLERYYDGDTTIEEEQQLKAFFAKGEVPAHLKAAQMQFLFLAEDARENMDAAFEDRFMAGVAPKARVIPVAPRFSRLAAGIAAGIFLISGMYIMRQDGGVKHANKPNDQQLMAYAQAKKSLLAISQRLNKGSEQVAKISKLDQVQEQITNKNSK